MRLGNYIAAQKQFLIVAAFVLLFGAVVFLPAQNWTPKAQAQAQFTAYELGQAQRTGQTPGDVAIQNQTKKEDPLNKIRKEDKWCTEASTCVSGIIYVFSVGLGSMLAYMGSSVLNLGIQLSLQSEAYSQLFLTTGWAAARDIANMLFIFILIYIAFTIIYSAETANTMKTLAAVVVMALLINFSFFITRVVIDAGNILAVQFYNAIETPQLSQTAANSTLADATNRLGFSPGDKKDLTFYLMETVKVQKILNETSFKKFTDQNGFLTNLIVQSTVYIVLGWAFAIIALTFFAVGFKFVLRIIVLWFVIIAAPLAFAMRAFASNDTARKFYNEWQSALLKFSFYPAVFLFMFLIMNFIMREMGGGGGLIPGLFEDLSKISVTNNDTLGLAALGAAMAQVIIRLGFVVVMLLFGLKLADQIMLSGSTFAENFTKKASEKMKGFAYRNTAGRALYGTSKALERSKWANKPGAVGWIGTKLRKQSFAFADKSYGGMRSRVGVLKDKSSALEERKGLLDKITTKERLDARDKENRELVETLRMVGPGLLTDVQRRRIASFSDREIAALDVAHVVDIAGSAVGPGVNFWNNQKMKSLESLTKYSDADRERVYQAWQAAQTQHASQQAATQQATQTQQTNQAPTQAPPAAPTQPAPQPAPHTPVPGNPGYVQTGSLITPNPTAVGTGSTSRLQPRISRITPVNATDKLLEKIDAGWANVKPRESRAAEFANLDKALAGVAEVAARAQARAATQPPVARSLYINPQTGARAQNIPIDTTHSMPSRVSRLDPAHTEPPTSTTPTPHTTPTPTPTTLKTPAPKTSLASWWNVPKDPAAEQLKALHGIKEELEEMREHAAETVPHNKTTEAPVTINQTVVQVGSTPPKTITPEAKELLASIDKGGVPAFMTQNLRRVLQQNGIKNSDISQKPLSELLEQLRKLQA